MIDRIVLNIPHSSKAFPSGAKERWTGNIDAIRHEGYFSLSARNTTLSPQNASSIELRKVIQSSLLH